MSSPVTSSITAELLELATPEELAELQEALLASSAFDGPLELAEYLKPGEIHRYPHTVYLNEIVKSFIEYQLYPSGPGPAPVWWYSTVEGEIHEVESYTDLPLHAVDFGAYHPETHEPVLFRLAIALPPRHGKSFIVTEYLPLWYWTKHSEDNIIFATYSDDFAAHWGARLRDAMVEHEKKLGYTVKGGHRAAASKLINTLKKGEMYLVGTGGSLTGKGGVLMIIDDPFKDAAEAYSQAERNNKDTWYHTVFVTRKTRKLHSRPPLEIMMFTRWHEDDITGRNVYNEDGTRHEEWYIAHLPAIAVENDPLGRKPGEALCPAIKNIRELESAREADPIGFAALYQGDPQISQGGITGHFRYYDHTKDKPEGGTLFASVDTAGTKNTWSDYSVFSLWYYLRQEETLYLVDVFRDKLESADLADWIDKLARRTKSKFVAIEDKTFGQTAIQELARRRKPYSVREIKADRDKVVRARPYGAAMYRGDVLFPGGIGAQGDYRGDDGTAPSWLAAWESEHASFPLGSHDDQVDTGSIAWEVVNTWRAKPPAPDRPSREEAYFRKQRPTRRQRGAMSGLLGH